MRHAVVPDQQLEVLALEGAQGTLEGCKVW